MAKYIWDTVTAVAPFAGFTPNYLIGACLSKSLPWAGVQGGGTATKVGFFKVLMKSTAAGMVHSCAGTSHKIKATGMTGTALQFAEFISMVKPTAYTAAMKIHGVSAVAGNGGTATKCKFWVDAYDSAGLRIATALLGTAPAGVTPVGFAVTGATTASTLSADVTVPVGGFLGFRIHPNNVGTVRMYGGAGWTGGGMVLNTIEAAAITGASVENRERFNDSKGVPLADGTKVYEYDAITMAYTGVVGLIGGAAVGAGAAEVGVLASAVGVGEVTFTRANADVGEYFYVIPDPASGNVWVLNTLMALGASINPASLAKLVAEVTTVGTTSGVEPLWDTLGLTAGSTVVDGTVTWTMRDVETICTNAVTGYQLGHWTAGMTAVIAAVGPPVVAATIIAPTAAGQHAVATAITTGIAGGVVPTWTGLANGVTVVDGGITWTITADKVYD